MTSSAILCPGINTVKNPETNKPIIHYLKRFTDSTGNLICDQSGCKFQFRDKDGNDIWVNGYIPETITERPEEPDEDLA